MNEIVAAGFAADKSDNSERADQSERIDSCVEKGGAKAITAAGHEAKQSIAGVGDGGVSEQPADVRLRERNEIADENREGGENGDDRAPAGNHRMPCSGSLVRLETEEQNFSQDE